MKKRSLNHKLKGLIPFSKLRSLSLLSLMIPLGLLILGGLFFYFFSSKSSIPDKVGTHDHLFPGHAGTIVVDGGDNVTKEPSVLPTSDEFLKLGYTEQVRIIKTHSKSDPKQTWEYLKSAVINKNGEVVYGANATTITAGGIDHYHIFGHMIGIELFRHYGFEGVKFCDGNFAYSCAHGVTEEAVRQKGVENLSTLADMCIKIDPSGKESRDTGCLHGMGHGLMSLGGLNLNKALDQCEKLGLKNPGHTQACYDGVFMEHTLSAPRNVIDEKNASQFCSSFKSDSQFYCNFYLPFLLKSKGLTTQKIYTICTNLPNDENNKQACFNGIYGTIGFSSKGDRQVIRTECAAFQDKGDINNCLIGAAGEVMYQRFVKWKDTVTSICSQVYPDGSCPLYTFFEKRH